MSEHSPLPIRRADERLSAHNVIEAAIDGKWPVLCQVGTTHSNNDEFEQKYLAFADEACRLFLAAPKLVEALEAVEWLGSCGLSNCRHCIMCGHEKGRHESDCRLALALQAAKAEGGE